LTYTTNLFGGMSINVQPPRRLLSLGLLEPPQTRLANRGVSRLMGLHFVRPSEGHLLF